MGKAVKYFNKILNYARSHIAVSTIAAVVVLGGGYGVYAKAHAASQPVKYVLTKARTERIVASVTGSGQVSATNQVDLKPKAGGEVVSIIAREGQVLPAGAAIAYIDSTDAQKTVRDAQTALESAQLSLQKLQKPADSLSVTQAQNAIAKAEESESDSKDDLAKAYDDGFTDVANAFVDLPDIISGLNTTLYGFDTKLGGSGQWNIDFYANQINTAHNDMSGMALANDAKAKYKTARAAYDKAFADYKATDRNADSATIEALIQESSDTVNSVSDAIKAMNNVIRVYEDALGNATPPSTAGTQLSSLNTYTSTVNGDVTALRNALSTIKNSKQAIADAERTIAENQESLQKLQDGTDPLDIKSAQLTVEQRQDALTDARNTLADYTIRAPFSGTLAKLDIHKGDSVSTGSAVATMVTKQQIAELSLNEVDAAKVAVGQKAQLTFDAIDGLTIDGSVASIDTIGTVSQGVVTYTVKVAFDTQDPRVKTGMTVNATITTDASDNALVVPSSAIKRQGENSYVLVVENPPAQFSPTGVELPENPKRVAVTTGISNDTQTEIKSGLNEGDTVVVRTVTGSTQAAATGNSGGLFGGPPQRGGGTGNVRIQAR
ncbi:MAG: efflux RND transporter periplasmic adaptor subunit [Candidatus Kaiserbacteria bacterium]|nr:efflux RND transporter periplasmic adaptor subunit [Candidatus Kaiserbacteria bacterium]